METSVAKWGNSLALRIPKSIANTTAINEGTPVEIHVDEDGAIVITQSKPRFNLADLLADYDPEKHRHSEIDSGPAVGGEVW